MGSWLSGEQKDLLVATLGAHGKVTLLLDGDDAGRECEARCLDELAPCLFVKVVRLPEPLQQPDRNGTPPVVSWRLAQCTSSTKGLARGPFSLVRILALGGPTWQESSSQLRHVAWRSVLWKLE
jgi:hypothetical protein